MHFFSSKLGWAWKSFFPPFTLKSLKSCLVSKIQPPRKTTNFRVYVNHKFLKRQNKDFKTTFSEILLSFMELISSCLCFKKENLENVILNTLNLRRNGRPLYLLHAPTVLLVRALEKKNKPSPNSERDSIMLWTVKSSFKTGLQISLSRDQSCRLPYLFWQKLVYSLLIFWIWTLPFYLYLFYLWNHLPVGSWLIAPHVSLFVCDLRTLSSSQYRYDPTPPPRVVSRSLVACVFLHANSCWVRKALFWRRGAGGGAEASI